MASEYTLKKEEKKNNSGFCFVSILHHDVSGGCTLYESEAKTEEAGGREVSYPLCFSARGVPVTSWLDCSSLLLFVGCTLGLESVYNTACTHIQDVACVQL